MTKKILKTDSSEQTKPTEPDITKQEVKESLEEGFGQGEDTFAEEQEVKESLVQPSPRPETPAISPAPLEIHVDKVASNGAKRNIQNATSLVGKNNPVIAGYNPRRKTKPDPPNQPLRSVPGTRTGVFIPNPTMKVNDVTKITHR